MVFKMSYGANDVPVKPVAVAPVVKKAAPRRRVKSSLTEQAQALFEPAPHIAEAEPADQVPV